ncbi:MAG: ribosomal protein [Gammaproteobacteria bacterium]|jgi:large subunit ribosomal protein L6|nr:ribosomal protein [Gammaproteobacteria bacterium]
MSRVAKKPISLPSGVEVKLNNQHLVVKGSKGTLEREIHFLVMITLTENILNFSPKEEGVNADAMAGTARALVNSMVIGVSQGFEKKLLLVGVGYKAEVKGKILNLNLGFSHPVLYTIPDGVTVETPSQTEVLVKGVDKELVGQVAADIRKYRPPEPYKGKGVRYSDEVIDLKEGKKK